MRVAKQALTSATNSDFMLEALKQIAPSVFTEVRGTNGELTHKVDFKALRELLGDAILDPDEECFGFHWVGKQDAKRAAAEPTRQTLRPVVEDSVDWDTTENLYIEGDNLEVLKLLQRGYLGKVKMIYIDPPYNTGNDFVYDDDFAMSQEQLDEAMDNLDEEGNRLRKNLDSNPRYHSDWCSMIYSRLLVARTLLANDGVIFISIDDNEVHHLRKICDEVFGAGNFVAELVRRTINSGKHDVTTIAPFHEYVLVYSKHISFIQLAQKQKDEAERTRLYKEKDQYLNDRGRFYVTQLNKNSISYSDSLNYPIKGPDGNDIWPGGGFDDKEWCWRWSKEKFDWGLKENMIVFKKTLSGKYKVYTKSYEFIDNDGKRIVRQNPYNSLEFIAKEYANFNATPELSILFDGKKYFNFPKSELFIRELIRIANCKENSLIIDFFSGSATTAHAVMQLNAEDGGKRKYICVQIPEETPKDSEARKAGYNTICEIGKERIRRAGKKIKEENKDKDIDTGFRVLRIDSSNMEDIYFEPINLKQNDLFKQVNSVKEGRTELDLLFGCMLDWGVELSNPLRTEEIAGKQLHIVNEGALVACFNKDINLEVIQHIAQMNPQRVIFRESCFEKDADKLNIYEQFKQLCGWNNDESYKRIHVI